MGTLTTLSLVGCSRRDWKHVGLSLHGELQPELSEQWSHWQSCRHCSRLPASISSASIFPNGTQADIVNGAKALCGRYAERDAWGLPAPKVSFFVANASHGASRPQCLPWRRVSELNVFPLCRQALHDGRQSSIRDTNWRRVRQLHHPVDVGAQSERQYLELQGERACFSAAITSHSPRTSMAMASRISACAILTTASGTSAEQQHPIAIQRNSPSPGGQVINTSRSWAISISTASSTWPCAIRTRASSISRRKMERHSPFRARHHLQLGKRQPLPAIRRRFRWRRSLRSRAHHRATLGATPLALYISPGLRRSLAG